MGSQSFIPGGAIATFSQATQLGRRRTGRRKKRRAGTKRATRAKSKRAGGRRTGRTGKPKPGTKAWMAYIRKKRKKKR